MRILDRLILMILSVFILALSICMIVIPLDFIEILSIDNLHYTVASLRGNYYLSVVGFLCLIISLRLVFILTLGNSKDKKKSFLETDSQYGKIVIYTSTVVGLVNNSVSKFTDITNIKSNIIFEEGQVLIELTGDVMSDVVIPEVSGQLQALVKEDVEKATGVIVRSIKIKINNVSTVNRALR